LALPAACFFGGMIVGADSQQTPDERMQTKINQTQLAIFKMNK
jgi:hypothetical protein